MPLIGFQGRPGAYSDLACRAARPGWDSVPYPGFTDVIEAVKTGQVQEALLPCENSLAGRVPEIHALLPESGLIIVGEHFHRVEHCLMGVKGACLAGIRRIHSHPMALAQARRLIQAHDLEAVAAFDTAGAAEMVAQWGRRDEGAVASSLAAALYGLEILQSGVEDATHNMTRFYRVALSDNVPDMPTDVPMMTTIVVRVKNVPGALYEVLGCFARYGANMTRIESYMLNDSFAATRFLMDIEGSPEEANCARAWAALTDISPDVHILGVYPRSRMRNAA